MFIHWVEVTLNLVINVHDKVIKVLSGGSEGELRLYVDGIEEPRWLCVDKMISSTRFVCCVENGGRNGMLSKQQVNIEEEERHTYWEIGKQW